MLLFEEKTVFQNVNLFLPREGTTSTALSIKNCPKKKKWKKPKKAHKNLEKTIQKKQKNENNNTKEGGSAQMLTLLSSGCLNQPVSPAVFLLPRVKFYLCHQRSKTRSFFPFFPVFVGFSGRRRNSTDSTDRLFEPVLPLFLPGFSPKTRRRKKKGRVGSLKPS